MFGTFKINLENLAVHFVGNKADDDGIRLSNDVMHISDEHIKALLQTYFLSAFKSGEWYHLHHEAEINLNETFNFASQIFDNHKTFYSQSVNFARHLYEQSTHSKIKPGELYVALFRGVIVDNEEMDAIGLFKSESKETYLKVSQTADNYSINQDEGININKLDKGCMIFNTLREDGYLVALVDTAGKGSEAVYWKDDFLNVVPRADDFHHTRNALTMARNFVVEKMPQEFDVSKADQADMLNKSVKFFKENESFTFDEFAQVVMQQPQVIESFNDYKNQFQSERDISMPDDFDINGQAVKQKSRNFKSVIKLDKNFHVYIHGDRDKLIKGVDAQTGLHYYQLLFEREL